MFIALSVLLLIALLVVPAIARRFADASDRKIINTICLCFGGVAMLGMIACCITVVPAGYRGVVEFFGDVNDKSLNEGITFVNPLCSVTTMNARVQKDEEKHPAETSDTQSVSVQVITNWRPRGDAMHRLYRNYGPKYWETIIPPAVREAVKAEVARYKVTELINQRPAIHRNVQEFINTWLTKYDLEVLEVAIGEIDFSEKYDAAIEAKQVQEQQALQKDYELKKTETEARMAAAVAEGEARSQVARASGEAESLKIRGEAKADYNRKIAESVTPMLIQSWWLDKWDGKLPIYSMGGDHGGPTPMLMIAPK